MVAFGHSSHSLASLGWRNIFLFQLFLTMAFVIEKVLRSEINYFKDNIIYVKWKNYSDYYNCWTTETIEDEPQEDSNEIISVPEKDNYISCDRILSIVRPMAKLETYKNDFIIENYYYQSLDKEKDYLLFWLLDDHHYVIFIFKQKIYLTDGENNIKKNKKALAILKKTLGTNKFNYCTMQGQGGLDHCGSSAILAGLEFLRMSRQGDIRLDLLPRQDLRPALVQRLHPAASKPLVGWQPVAQRQGANRCTRCGAFHRRRANLKRHEALCRG